MSQSVKRLLYKHGHLKAVQNPFKKPGMVTCSCQLRWWSGVWRWENPWESLVSQFVLTISYRVSERIYLKNLSSEQLRKIPNINLWFCMYT